MWYKLTLVHFKINPLQPKRQRNHRLVYEKQQIGALIFENLLFLSENPFFFAFLFGYISDHEA